MSDGVQSGKADYLDERERFAALLQHQTMLKASAIPANEIIQKHHSGAIHDLNEQRVALRNYIYSKMSAEDWHAVADAAMDLREIDAKLSVLRA